MRRIDDGLSSEDRSQMSEDRSQMSEDRRQMSEDRRQMSEVRCKIIYILSFVLLLLTIITSTFISCSRTTESKPGDIGAVNVCENEGENTGGPPSLVVDTGAPLLLDEPIVRQFCRTAVVTTRAASANTACFVCHANYKTESLANDHAKADIGCVNCHGQSSAHQNDENNITPPETIYSADKIDPFCRSCHKAHNISPKNIIARWLKRNPDKTAPTCRGQGCHETDDVPPEKVVARWMERGLDRTEPNEIVCTDCHGDHRMKVRTIIWDKGS